MNGHKEKDGSFIMESMKSKPDPDRPGKVIFDDMLTVYFKHDAEAYKHIELLLWQLKDKHISKEKYDISLSFSGELSFQKDD